MRSKTGFIVGVILTVFGIVIVLGNIAFNYSVCMCPNQPIGQPNTCFCPLPSSYYPLEVVGLAAVVLGLAIVIYSIMKPKVQT